MVDQGELENMMMCEWKKYADYKIKNNVNNGSLPMEGLYNCYDCPGVQPDTCPNYLTSARMKELRCDLINGDYR